MIKAFNTQSHEVASHTVSHAHLTQVNATTLDNELKNAQTTIQTQIGKAVPNFATPYGEYNAAVITAIKKYYATHRSTDEGYNTKDNIDLYNIKVQNVMNTTTVAQVQAWVNQAQQDKSWLVLVYHGVDTTQADQYFVTPTGLDQQLNAIKNSGISVQTLQGALNEIKPQL